MAKKVQIGKIISKSDKTISVRVERQVKHPTLFKIIKLHKNILAHDENSKGQLGQIVEIIESKPVSKRKSWSLKKIIE